MYTESAIIVKDIKKSFKVYADKSRQLKDLITNLKRASYEKRDVLKGISFEVKKGEAIGLIGKNGCGKSTTLKLLTKILKPTEGTIEIKGRVSSLIELGAGFHPDMSGRENIYINASIFGFTAKEVDKRLESIIRFSELEDFIDNPIRTYSSGMYMRLAFSVAINVDADILLIDEILGVGDAAFQTKCFNKLKELKDQGTTIVIVSHALGQVEQICDRAIWIWEGLIKEIGTPRMICSHYSEAMEKLRHDRVVLEQNMMQENSNNIQDENTLEWDLSCRRIAEQCGTDAKREGSGEVSFSSVKVVDMNGNMKSTFETGEALKVIMKYKTEKVGREINFNLSIVRGDWIPCYTVSSERDTSKWIEAKKEGGLTFSIDSNCLLENKYLLSLEITGKNNIHYDTVNNIVEIQIKNETTQEFGIVSMPHKWNID